MDFSQITNRIKAAHPDALLPVEDEARYLRLNPQGWPAAAQFLRDDPDLHFDFLQCLSGYDPGPGKDLGVAYNLFSLEKRHSLEIRIEAPREGGSIPSVASVWRAADWHEREVFDLYGITFEGHPDLRRILLPDDWVGYPLRKDYETPETYRGIPVPKDKRGWE